MSDCLVLNRDAQPLSILPLSTINWQEAIRYMVLDKATVLEWHNDWIVRSANWSTRVPAVIMLNEYQKPKSYVRLTKRNVFLRDHYTCQYCDAKVSDKEATVDHVHPLSKGGGNTWANLVTACRPCNYRKSDKRHMKPKRVAYKPDYWELVQRRRELGFTLHHKSWALYLNPANY